MKKSVLEVVDVAIAIAVMGAVVVVARRSKGSGALSGSALLGGAQMSSSLVEIGLGGGGLSIGLRGASQGGFASELCYAGLLLCGASGIGVAVGRRCTGGQGVVVNAGRRHGAGLGGRTGCNTGWQRDDARGAALGGRGARDAAMGGRGAQGAAPAAEEKRKPRLLIP